MVENNATVLIDMKNNLSEINMRKSTSKLSTKSPKTPKISYNLLNNTKNRIASTAGFHDLKHSKTFEESKVLEETRDTKGSRINTNVKDITEFLNTNDNTIMNTDINNSCENSKILFEDMSTYMKSHIRTISNQSSLEIGEMDPPIMHKTGSAYQSPISTPTRQCFSTDLNTPLDKLPYNDYNKLANGTSQYIYIYNYIYRTI